MSKDFFNFDAYSSGTQTYNSAEDIKSVIKSFENYYLFNEKSFSYHPETEFVQRPITSENINVRWTDFNLPYRFNPEMDVSGDQTKSIFCFGGSTTFGSYVRDNETWPAFLGAILKDSINVYNYGCSAWTISQETNALISLLKSGQRPNAVFFMDGFNLGPNFDGSEFSTRIASLFRKMQINTFTSDKLLSFDFIKSKIKDSRPLAFENLLVNDPVFDGYENDSILYEYYINRFIINSRIRHLLAKEFNFQLIQVLQPIAFLGYNTEYLPQYIKVKYNPNEYARIKKLYSLVYKGVLSNDSSWVDMKDLCNKYKYPVFIDGCHYSPSFNFAISFELAKYLKINNALIDIAPGKNATGSSYIMW
jgi:lysophospholipase L1-like esterase